MQMDETGFPSLSTSSPTVAFLHSPARRSETNSRGRRDLNPIEVTALRGVVFRRDTQYQKVARFVRTTRGGTIMNRRIHCRTAVSLVFLVAAGLLLAPLSGYAQTEGMERRQNRRQNRDDARATRQEGRHTARDAKQACKDAGGNRIDCRHKKRELKQDARGAARDQKHGTDSQPNQ